MSEQILEPDGLHYDALSKQYRELSARLKLNPPALVAFNDSLLAASRLQELARLASASESLAKLSSLQVASTESFRQQVLEASQAATSFADAVARVQKQLHEASAVGDAAMAKLHELGERSLPPNWRPIDSEMRLKIPEKMLALGWCLAWVPRFEIVLAVMEEDDPHAVLLDRSAEVIDDAEEAIEQITADALGRHKTGALEALANIRDDRLIAAQATATAVLTHALHDILEAGTLSFARKKLAAIDPYEVGYAYFRIASILATIGLKSLETYEPEGPVPQDYNRHASSHTLSEEQYNATNAVVSVMNLASLLRELQEYRTRDLGEVR